MCVCVCVCVYSLCIETAEVRGKRSWVHVIRCTSSQFLSERGAHIFGFRLCVFRFSLLVFHTHKNTQKKSKNVKENENEVDGDGTVDWRTHQCKKKEFSL